MSDFFDQFHCEANPDFSVVIEDDGRVAYAYLLIREDVVADVWLYNQAATPDSFVLEENDLPLLNSAEFAKPESLVKPISGRADVSVDWHQDAQANITGVKILIQGILVGKLWLTSKLGMSANAAQDGPLAKKMSESAL